MFIRLGLEIGFENKRILCWGLDYPGCFTYGTDTAEALLKFPQTLLKHASWVALHTDQPWIELTDMDFGVVETFNVHNVQTDENSYEVNAFFKDDLRPLSENEVNHALMLHQWQQEELLAGVETLPEHFVNQFFPGQLWNVKGIVSHIARAEKFYLNCLKMPSPDSTATDPFDLLDQQFQAVQNTLPGLVDLERQTSYMTETWSPRKFVRRLLWHQRDHIGHIRELVDQYL
ncbi:MAG: DinB family protein [Anaerolineaceae bacterium]